MKTMSTGMLLSTLSLGFFLSSALVTIVHKKTGESGHVAWLPDDLNKGKLYYFYWLRARLPDDLNKGKLYYFYWLLSVLIVANLVVFLVSAKWYVYKGSRVAMME